MVTVVITGAAMTAMGRLDHGPEHLAVSAAGAALADAELEARDIGAVVAVNALGDALCGQGMIRGQVWLRGLGLSDRPVFNLENACAGGSSAVALGSSLVEATRSPVLVVGAEKMWTGERGATLAAIEGGLPADEREALHQHVAGDTGSVFMGLNSRWAAEQIRQGWATPADFAAAAAKSYLHGAANPRAQHRTPRDIPEILGSRRIAGPLTRLMCSSFTDGGAAVVLESGPKHGAPRLRATTARSGFGKLEYHERLATTAAAAWEEAGVVPSDLDLIEVHDATSAEELYALESVGLFEPGDAGPATSRGLTSLGARAGTVVNPSGGLVARGHPIGITGLCQIVELVDQLRSRAEGRQVDGARLGAAVNSGGIIDGDAAIACVTVVEAP